MDAPALLTVAATILVLLAGAIRKEGAQPSQSKKDHHVSDRNTLTSSWSEDINGQGMSIGSKWQSIRQRVLARDKYKCVMCGSTDKLTIDHIKELSLGGSNELTNLRTLCASCHQKRHHNNFLDRPYEADDNYGENYKLSHKKAKIIEAIKTGKSVGIKYIDRDGLRSERVIRPKRIYKSKFIYVDAYCELDKADRVFRLSRMELSGTARNFYANASNSYTSRPWAGGIWDHKQ